MVDIDPMLASMIIMVISHTSFVFAQDVITAGLEVEIKRNSDQAVLKHKMKNKLRKVNEPIRIVGGLAAGIVIGRNIECVETISLKVDNK